MRFETNQNDLRSQRRSNRMLGGIVALQSAALLLSLAIIVSILGSERTVVVPPSIDRSFWITKDRASKEYLEQMAGFVAWLYLDVSPTTVDWKRQTLLNWVDPEQYGAMKTRMDLEADRLRSNNGSTFFLLQQLAADEARQSVLVTGRLRRQINGADIGEPETRTYLAQFRFTGGRTHIQTFKEVIREQPGQVSAATAVRDAGAR